MAVQTDLIEAVASFALANPGHDLAKRGLEACAHYLDLYRPPAYENYVPSALLKAHAGQFPARVQPEPTGACAGDPALLLACLDILAHGAQLELDSELVLDSFDQDDTPSIALGFDGFGRFPETLAIGGVIPISLEELGVRLTLATRGGRLDRTGNGLLLRLKGVRMAVEPTAQWEPLRAACEAALASPSDETLRRVLAEAAPDEQNVQPADIDALLSDTLREQQDELLSHGVRVESLSEGGLPPIAVSRTALQRLARRACQLAAAMLTRGGTLSVLSSYVQKSRETTLMFSIEGVRPQPPDVFLLASMERATVDLHNGTFDATEDKQGVSIAITLPDAIGRSVDAWIPGFDSFTDRSKQVLRLLKTPGCALPEEAFLGGVLEEELTQWLMPCLEAPMARNVAHELSADVTGLPGGNQARLEKALEQVRRGKPRKEIVKPPYTGELLYAFRHDARTREAVGAARLSESEFGALCAMLMRTPLAYVDCLRLIAAAREG